MGRPRSRFDSNQSQMLGTKDAAAILGVSVSTVQKMVADGRLPAWKTSGGHRRIELGQLQKIASQLEVPTTVAVAHSPASSAALESLPLSILVVEDNPVAAKAVTKTLEHFGQRVRVTLTGDGAEALLHAARHRPDLLIIDLVMKPFDGFHLLHLLDRPEANLQVPVVVVTGLSQDQIEARGGVPRDVPLYQKPLHPQRLLGLVEGLLLRRLRTLG